MAINPPPTLSTDPLVRNSLTGTADRRLDLKSSQCSFLATCLLSSSDAFNHRQSPLVP